MKIFLLIIVILAFCYGVYLMFEAKRPVTRKRMLKEILKTFKEGNCCCLCAVFYRILERYDVEYNKIQDIFPLFTFETAQEQFCAVETYKPFWWDKENREVRISFLKWLIQQYEHDKQNFRGPKRSYKVYFN